MDSGKLVEQDKVVGRSAFSAFSADADLGLRAMFWRFSESHDDWRLYVASKYCDKHGPRATYLRLRRLLERAGLLDDLSLDRIDVAATGDSSVPSLESLSVHANLPPEITLVRGSEVLYVYLRKPQQQAIQATTSTSTTPATATASRRWTSRGSRG